MGCYRGELADRSLIVSLLDCARCDALSVFEHSNAVDAGLQARGVSYALRKTATSAGAQSKSVLDDILPPPSVIYALRSTTTFLNWVSSPRSSASTSNCVIGPPITPGGALWKPKERWNSFSTTLKRKWNLRTLKAKFRFISRLKRGQLTV
jgi:hypothetical protein